MACTASQTKARHSTQRNVHIFRAQKKSLAVAAGEQLLSVERAVATPGGWLENVNTNAGVAADLTVETNHANLHVGNACTRVSQRSPGIVPHSKGCLLLLQPVSAITNKAIDGVRKCANATGA